MMQIIPSDIFRILAHPLVRVFSIAASLVVSAYLAYVFAYMPLQEGVEDFTIQPARVVRINANHLDSLLTAADNRTKYAGQNFFRAQSIFSHEKPI